VGRRLSVAACVHEPFDVDRRRPSGLALARA
jgi:hypothetical protein